MESVAIPFSKGSSRPRDQTQVSCIAGGFFTIWAIKAVPGIIILLLPKMKHVFNGIPLL